MTALDWLLWFAIVWATLFAYAAIDVPTLIGRWMRGHR
jgi:hypothetical protein